MKIDLTNIYKKYKGLWVALDSTLRKVMSADEDASKAYNEAIKRGYKKPTMFKVPFKNLPYLGFSTPLLKI